MLGSHLPADCQVAKKIEESLHISYMLCHCKMVLADLLRPRGGFILLRIRLVGLPLLVVEVEVGRLGSRREPELVER